ncbi:MAG: hypothetical protein HN855_00525 [Anaerolineae bacterium]|jgi:hypothetical protein|nr:hypothetical protein [Anaerolineae bacterium]MBT7069685.1 hypothetical protein [Anaerolineae bacterium]MBT7323625.1 hypothetical protein [Anaerolineae bacterium]MBT7601809.1 hypothetical protein [Anaerolineae bacterium]
MNEFLSSFLSLATLFALRFVLPILITFGVLTFLKGIEKRRNVEDEARLSK